jgi:NAD(P)-dependent dehydrogenase (short-subunit alcohol dehydrogenase family)
MASGIVIGAGPGIGAAVARRLAREGFSVGAVARSQNTLDDVIASLDGARAFGASADVTDERGLRETLDHLVEELGGPPELLVYNAGKIQQDRPGELTAREHLDAWAVNVVGAITAATHLARDMKKGTIIFTGGMPEPLPVATSLSLGKAGIRALTELLAREYGQAGIHVATVTVAGAVEPGTAFDPDAIAEQYWRLHTQPADRWEREVLYTG